MGSFLNLGSVKRAASISTPNLVNGWGLFYFCLIKYQTSERIAIVFLLEGWNLLSIYGRMGQDLSLGG